jgi:hypothetical protein
MFFFDGDNGWYDYYNFETETWEWGWWYLDSNLTYLVFDSANAENTYKVKSISKTRIVLEITDEIQDKYTYVFNAYDLNDPLSFGDYAPSTGVTTLTGGSSRTFYKYAESNDVDSAFNYTTMSPDTASCEYDDSYVFSYDLSLSYDNKGTTSCSDPITDNFNEWWALLPNSEGIEDKELYLLIGQDESYYDVVFLDANNLVIKQNTSQNFYDFIWLKANK